MEWILWFLGKPLFVIGWIIFIIGAHNDGFPGPDETMIGISVVCVVLSLIVIGFFL